MVLKCITIRELWELDDLEITIDEWPFLEPLMEIEGKSEIDVKNGCKKLNLTYNKALFCSITTLYSKKYNLPEYFINNNIPKVTFETKNPFITML